VKKNASNKISDFLQRPASRFDQRLAGARLGPGPCSSIGAERTLAGGIRPGSGAPGLWSTIMPAASVKIDNPNKPVGPRSTSKRISLPPALGPSSFFGLSGHEIEFRSPTLRVRRIGRLNIA